MQRCSDAALSSNTHYQFQFNWPIIPGLLEVRPVPTSKLVVIDVAALHLSNKPCKLAVAVLRCLFVEDICWTCYVDFIMLFFCFFNFTDSVTCPDSVTHPDSVHWDFGALQIIYLLTYLLTLYFFSIFMYVCEGVFAGSAWWIRSTLYYTGWAKKKWTPNALRITSSNAGVDVMCDVC